MAKIIELILVHAHKGKGTQESPCYLAAQLWTKDGRLVVEDNLGLEPNTCDLNSVNL